MTVMLRFTWIWIFLHVAKASRNKIDIKLYQVSLVPRPIGEVTLVCKTDHALRDVSVIRWYKHDTMALLYTFSMVPKINKIEDPYKNIVMDAWTFPVHRGVVSKLRLRTNVSDEYVYRCDMASNDGSHRRKKLKIRFDEPTIRVAYSIENDHVAESRISALVNITCQTGVTDGRPKYQILYDHRPALYSNPDQDRTYYDEKNMGYYYSSTWSEIIELSGDGIVICKVEDNRGLYTKTQNIILFPDVTSSPGESDTSVRNMQPTSIVDPSKWSSMLIVLPCFISVIAAVLLTWITYQILKLRKRLTLTEQTIRDQSVQQPVQQPAAREHSPDEREHCLRTEGDPELTDGLKDSNLKYDLGSEDTYCSSSVQTDSHDLITTNDSREGTLRFRDNTKKKIEKE